MRRCGKGYQGLRKFLALINHPTPMTEKNYRKINLKFSDAVRVVAMRSINEAAEEVHRTQTHKDLIVETTGVPVDGTWQRRGFSSLHGAVAALNSGKVIDIACFSKYCQGCISIEILKYSDPARYEFWKTDHKCSINHTGSTPAMEKAGAQIICQRSITGRKLKYGDSKSFAAVKDTYDVPMHEPE